MDTLNDLLAASDLVSLHCALTNETVQILNADCLQHIKPGIILLDTHVKCFSDQVMYSLNIGSSTQGHSLSIQVVPNYWTTVL